jgi:hypothetical protein
MKKKDKEILVRIDQYIRGELRAEEKEALWKEFLQQPEYLNWFETELHLRHFKNPDNSFRIDEAKGGENRSAGGSMLNGQKPTRFSQAKTMHSVLWLMRRLQSSW